MQCEIIYKTWKGTLLKGFTDKEPKEIKQSLDSLINNCQQTFCINLAGLFISYQLAANNSLDVSHTNVTMDLRPASIEMLADELSTSEILRLRIWEKEIYPITVVIAASSATYLEELRKKLRYATNIALPVNIRSSEKQRHNARTSITHELGYLPALKELLELS